MTSRSKTVAILVLFFSWIILTSMALFYFGNQHYGQFGSNSNWQAAVPVTLAISALGIAPAAGKQVVHVQQPDCSCNSRAKQHINQFTDEYQLPAAAQFQRELSQVVAAGLALPATPAVLIYNNGQLIYAGPYATGPLCSVADSLIAPILRDEVKLAGLWLNGEANACRCVVPELLSQSSQAWRLMVL